ncbi:DUF4355 domain-containing protein [Clostridium chrysemydis]|uniref:DUF4355 domain-containing protein n=1 Tax=Clostridium chrysemydis TaxID=2665504 RepID=UPI001883CD12|nr:DUF4355 domain-containing protein [Clostridium chrysemydis]
MADVNTVIDPAGVNANEVDQQGGNKTPEIKLPQSIEELQALLQSEGDKRVASAIKKREEKLKADFEAKIEKEKAEAARLAKMTQAEREKAVLEAERKSFEAERKAFAKTQLLNQTMVELQKESLPVTFAEYMMADTAEEVIERINSFKKVWQEALQVAVDERIKSKTPKAGTSNNTTITKEDFKKMTYRERVSLYDSNPELYKSLNK